MKHEDIQVNLADYLSGRLSASDRRLVDSHLMGCEECADFVADVRPLSEVIARHGEALFDDHPEPIDLMRLRDGTAGPEAARIRRHLAVCAACSLQASPPAAPLSPPARRFSRLLKTWGMLAAGLILGFAVAPLVRGPSPSLDGPIDLPVLDRVTRSGQRVTRIAVRDGQGAVVIAIPVDSLNGRPEDETIRFIVSGPGGARIYSLEGSVGWIKRTTGAPGILPLMIESPRLPPGSYEVAIQESGEAQEPIAVLPFEVVGADGR